MNVNYTIMNKHLSSIDLSTLSINDFLKTFELNEHDAVIELLDYINVLAKNYIPGSDHAYMLFKASHLMKQILPNVEFKSNELGVIKKKATKTKNLIINLRELEPTKTRKHHFSKIINIFEKAHFKLDRSDEKIYDRLKKYIKNRVSIDYICEYVSSYSGWAEEVNNGITIYDFIIEEALNLFPIKDNSYDIYYFIKLMKALRKKAVILNDSYIKKINKLRAGRLSKKEDILLLEISYIIEGNEYELDADEINSKYGMKKLPNLENEYFTEIIVPKEKQRDDLTVITIDPSLTSLKDDGLSIRQDGNNYILGVHITDVNSRVEENGIVDSIARQNFKTFYEGSLKVYEMIDSRYSLPLFSLEEDHEMPVLSLYAVITNTGDLDDFYFNFDQIKVHKNLTYEEGDELLKGNSDISKDLNDLLYVSELLKKGNKAEEYRKIKELINNSNNADYAYSTHSIVAEAMVLYNELMAKTFFEDDEAPFIYRVHTEPTDEEVIKVIKLLTSPDESVSLGHARNGLISKVRELYPSAHYSAVNLGHHGLGLDYYAHATSPGRRYPDLVSQRLYYELFYKTRTIQKIENYSRLCENYAKMYNLYSKIQADYYKELSLTKKK